MVAAVMVVMGGGVLLVGMFALAIGVGLSLTLWQTWWLHPMWSLVMVPVGLPMIDFWHLFAINLFISVMFFLPAAQDYAKQTDKLTRTASKTLRVVVLFLRPVMAFYVIRWAL